MMFVRRLASAFALWIRLYPLFCYLTLKYTLLKYIGAELLTTGAISGLLFENNCFNGT